jgi:demethylmenaquinone methyltransferase/2-methoxy-6-polyprenyl-1,4-benzoquinol methylase
LLLREQLDYYRARAAEYDEWWTRRGRYDRGESLNARWFAEAAALASALAVFAPAGRVLELACGTGIWTEKLAGVGSHVTALDGSAEMLALAARRVRSANVRFVEADLFAWQPSERYDVIFFGFWLSHVPPLRFGDFWRLVESCLAPGGRVFFVDSRYEPTSTAVDHRLAEPQSAVQRRRLNDGREFEICKVFYEPAELARRLSSLGWISDVRATPRYFIYGRGWIGSAQDTQNAEGH